MKVIYQHPDGYSIGIKYTDTCHYVISKDDEGRDVHIPVGPRGLLILGAEFIRIGAQLTELEG